MDFLNSLNNKNTIAFGLLLLPFCLFYLAFQFIQFNADGIFYNLVFDIKYTFLAISYIFLYLFGHFFQKKEQKVKKYE